MSTSNRRADLGEWRRQRAWELSQQGWQQGWWQKDIAAALGVSRAAVCQWIRRAREKGAAALRNRPHVLRACVRGCGYLDCPTCG